VRGSGAAHRGSTCTGAGGVPGGRRCSIALPFTSLRLTASRPHCLPRGYPTELKTLGDHIRRRRLDLRLLQRTVADQLGVRVDTVTLWENGRVRPLARHYGPIVRFLGYDPEPGDHSLAGRLRTIRRRLGLTQAEFAAKVGLDEGSVCRWESGSRRPSRWMDSRVLQLLTRLEEGDPGGRQPRVSYLEATRWRRRPPHLPYESPRTAGERIRSVRLKLGESQGVFGDRFGVSRHVVRSWETDRSNPPSFIGPKLTGFLSFRPSSLRQPSLSTQPVQASTRLAGPEERSERGSDEQEVET
jgi:DNA-binding transcriptional regulator YiaG